MITINKYLDDILFDFKEYVTSGVRLCDLKEVHFDAGNLPDYSDIHVQQLYLLRYAYAYSFEYKRMYASLIRRMNPGMEIAVTSIGCGSMIDYWALTRVVPNRCTIRYRGIDTIDWSYRMEQRPQDDVLFRNADAVELVSKAKYGTRYVQDQLSFSGYAGQRFCFKRQPQYVYHFEQGTSGAEDSNR